MGRKRSKSISNSISSNNIGEENAQKEKIVIDINQTSTYDASNPLVIVPKKKDSKKLKVKEKVAAAPKPLSKKQRKKLQKIIETRKKKLNRTELFQKLSQVQATTEEIEQLTSTSDMQTFGIRRFTKADDCNINQKKISNIRGINRKSKIPLSKKRKLDENIDTDSETEDTKNSSNSESDETKSTSNSEIDMSDEENEHLPDYTEVKEETSLVEENAKNNNQHDYEPNKQAVQKEENSPTQISKENASIEKVLIPSTFVPVHRNPDIQALREALPIYAEEQPLMEAIRENSVVIIHGETGSGKTTQVPQFLYEAGYTQDNMLIGITEPRRIAAMSMAARVGEELNMPKAVSYHIRYEKTVNPETKIKFMTDGVLLKEMKNDFHLSRYSVIIIDEAHERSVFSDVLIGLLSRVVHRHKFKKRNYPPLKLIIMSATMCVEEFMGNPRLFKEPPFLFKVTSRQYTVQAHFNKNTPEDYVEAAYNKVCKIHRQLPSGAILVFLTGENEIKQLCKLLRETFPSKEIESGVNVEDKEKSSSPIKQRKRRKKCQGQSDIPDINLDNYTIEPLDTEDLQHQLSEGEEQQTTAIAKKFEDVSLPLLALPLYSILPLKDQEKVFQPPPQGSRLCVVATNVAETSITIPGLKYVVDSGKVKTKVYNKNSGGISKFVITWCSKASSNQRAGRAGRTEGGHCYRLYSSAVFDNEFPDFSPPEILRMPADDVLLQMKALGITNVVDFPFPSSPDAEALKAAEHRLVLLGALKDSKDSYGKFPAIATAIGKAMARFPLSPRYAAMLLLSKKHNCIPCIVAIVCAMTVTDVFVSSAVNVDEEGKTENSENVKVMWQGIKKIGAGKGVHLRLGDPMVLLRAVALYESSKNKVKFCIKNGIRHRAMTEIHKMQLQLYKEMSQAFTDVDMPKEITIEYPSEEEIEKVRKIVAAGLTDHIARRIPAEEGKKDKKFKNAYQCMELEEPIFIHPSSILFSELPEYVAYQEIVQTSRYFMKGVVEIEDSWIPCMVPSICEFSDPLEDPPPFYDSEKDKILVTMDVKIGRWLWEVQVVDIEIPKGILKYKWFCFFLLDGQIWSFFTAYKTFTKPSIVLKNWAKSLAPRMMLLLNTLSSKDVDSKKALEHQWETDSSYLLKEFLGLLPSNKHLEVECRWPPKS